MQFENSVFRQMRVEHTMQIYHNFYEYDFMDPANLLTALWKSDGVTGAPQARLGQPGVRRPGHPGRQRARHRQAPGSVPAGRAHPRRSAAAAFLCTQNIFQVWYPYISGIVPNERGEVAYRYLDVSRFQMYINNQVDQYRTATL